MNTGNPSRKTSESMPNNHVAVHSSAKRMLLTGEDLLAPSPGLSPAVDVTQVNPQLIDRMMYRTHSLSDINLDEFPTLECAIQADDSYYQRIFSPSPAPNTEQGDSLSRINSLRIPGDIEGISPRHFLVRTPSIPDIMSSVELPWQHHLQNVPQPQPQQIQVHCPTCISHMRYPMEVILLSPSIAKSTGSVSQITQHLNHVFKLCTIHVNIQIMSTCKQVIINARLAISCCHLFLFRADECAIH